MILTTLAVVVVDSDQVEVVAVVVVVVVVVIVMVILSVTLIPCRMLHPTLHPPPPTSVYPYRYVECNKLSGVVPALPFAQYDLRCWIGGPTSTETDCAKAGYTQNQFSCPLPLNSAKCTHDPPSCK